MSLSTPLAIPANIITDLITALNKLDCHSLIIIKDDTLLSEVYWQPYSKQQKQSVYSISKSFTAVAVAFALQESLISLDSRIYDILKDDINFIPSAAMQKVTVHDILSMQLGFIDKEIQLFYLCHDWLQHIMHLPLNYNPGTNFFYDNQCPYLISVIIKKITGLDLLDYLQPRLFIPLGITDISWEKNSQGYNLGAWGLNIRTEDLAKFGQFILHNGKFNGKQLIAAKYIKLLSAFHANTKNTNISPEAIDNRQGYGYYFWHCQHKDAFRAAGLFGQYCLILPAENMVIALTAGYDNTKTQHILNAIWHFITAVSKLPFKSYHELNNCLTQQQISLPSTNLSLIYPCRHYQFERNKLHLKNIILNTLNNKTLKITLIFNDKTLIFEAGHNYWHKNICGNNLDFASCGTVFFPNPHAAYGIKNNHLEIKLVYTQTPFVDIFVIEETNDIVSCHYIPKPAFLIRCTEGIISGIIK